MEPWDRPSVIIDRNFSFSIYYNGGVGPGTASVRMPGNEKSTFGRKSGPTESQIGVSGSAGGSQKPPFHSRRGPGPSKNAFREGFRKKHEKPMENGPEKVRFFEENTMLKRNKHGAGAKF